MSLRCAAACCVVRSGSAPPQTAYVNGIIMLFRSIDRPVCQALPVRGQEPWGCRVCATRRTERRRLVLAGGWVAASSRLRPHAEPLSCGLCLQQPVRRRQTDDESQIPRLPSDISAVLACCCQTSDITLTYSPNPNLPKRRLQLAGVSGGKGEMTSVTFPRHWD